MSDKLFNKLQQVIELKLEGIKDEIYSSVQNLREELEQQLDIIIAEVEQEEKVENAFKIELDTLTKIITKGKVTKLEGSVYDLNFRSPADRLFLNDRGVIRPPFNTFDNTSGFEIVEIELTLPSGKVLDTKDVKELFAE